MGHFMYGSADIVVDLLRLFAMAMFIFAMRVMRETVREMPERGEGKTLCIL
jgi:hypothetical protein